MTTPDMPIRVQVLSDIHAEFTGGGRPYDLPVERLATGADIVLLAGDTDRYSRSVGTARELFPDAAVIVMVAGNHEPYKAGRSIDVCIGDMKEDARKACAPGRTVAVLEKDVLTVDVRGVSVRILGTTLWTNFGLFGRAGFHRKVVSKALNDYALITAHNGRGMFTAAESIRRHTDSTAFLRQALEAHHGGPTLVMTHHLPSLRSISARYRDDPVSAGFASARDDLLAMGACLWTCGHTHDSHQYRDDSGTLVVCNPAGYPSRETGLRENQDFNPGLVVGITRDDGRWTASPA